MAMMKATELGCQKGYWNIQNKIYGVDTTYVVIM